ncbi:MAG: TolB family protein [Solirubrobacterales bacterium]
MPEPVAVASGVPDQGRAWEILSPEEPMGAVLAIFAGLADNGDRIVYETRSPIPGSPSGDAQAANISIRRDSGWVNEQLPSPYSKTPSLYPYEAAVLFDSDLRASLGWSWIPAQGPFSEVRGVFRGEPDGTFALKAVLNYNDNYFIGGSADLRRSFFTSLGHLVPADAGRTAGRSIFELDDAGIHQLDVDTAGNLLFACGADVPPGSGIAADGRRVFIVPGSECHGQGGVYLREGGTTTEISSPSCALPDCGGEPDPRFAGATPDGAHAFLFAETRLTADDTDPAPDLYRYDVGSGQLTLLTGTPGLVPTGAQAVPAPDGSAVAFGAADEGSEGTAILDAHGTRFLATPPSRMEWSADSRYSVFSTKLQLTPQDHDGQLDVYRYDSQSGTFTEVSAGLAGAGNGAFAAELGGGAGLELLTRFLPGSPYRVMSADGQRVFFGTAERLVPEDGNEAPDVYEWAGGSLGLISSGGGGAGEGGSTYLNATPDGRTVVFRTAQTLLRRDRDGGDFDYYAARIGGGFPEPPEPPGPGCEGASCRAAGSSPLAISPPAAAQGKLALRRPIAAERARFAASGWLELLAEAPRSGKLSARARARLGSRPRTIASTAVRVSEAGPVRLRLRLSPAARKALRRGKALRVRVAVSMGRRDTAHQSFSIARRP